MAWQVAQSLGSENEEDLKNHALLLAVDYAEELLPFIEEAGGYLDIVMDNGSTIRINSSYGFAHDMKQADEQLYLVKALKKEKRNRDRSYVCLP